MKDLTPETTTKILDKIKLPKRVPQIAEEKDDKFPLCEIRRGT
nr:252_t:CDS:2 [Entrophospora candida]